MLLGNNSRTKQLALSGILMTLTVITLFFATTMPVNELSLFALSSFFIAVVIIEGGIRTGWIFYASSCLLAFAVLPNKLAIVPYIFFFGLYGIVKYYIERINNIVLEYVLKLGVFNLVLFLAAIIVNELIVKLAPVDKYPWWIIVIAFEAAFVVYDYVYTLIVQYYRDRLRRLLKL